jgi:hypothetical protein
LPQLYILLFTVYGTRWGVAKSSFLESEQDQHCKLQNKISSNNGQRITLMVNSTFGVGFKLFVTFWNSALVFNVTIHWKSIAVCIPPLDTSSIPLYPPRGQVYARATFHDLYGRQSRAFHNIRLPELIVISRWGGLLLSLRPKCNPLPWVDGVDGLFEIQTWTVGTDLVLHAFGGG